MVPPTEVAPVGSALPANSSAELPLAVEFDLLTFAASSLRLQSDALLHGPLGALLLASDRRLAPSEPFAGLVVCLPLSFHLALMSTFGAKSFDGMV